MTLRYITTNLINSTTLPSDDATYRTTEDAIYKVANLYNKRPSKPFRFTAKAAQWLKVELAAATPVTFAGIFNHNIPSGETINLEGANADAGYAAVCTAAWRNHDIGSFFTATWKWWKLNIGVQVADPFPQIGEFVLGNYSTFASAWVQPGQADGPTFAMAESQTHYGQDWSEHLANTQEFRISLLNLTDPATVDDLQTFLTDIFENSNGKFILIPDHTKPHCFYVRVKNYKDFAYREIYGTKELRRWSLELETLTRGITLL